MIQYKTIPSKFKKNHCNYFFDFAYSYETIGMDNRVIFLRSKIDFEDLQDFYHFIEKSNFQNEASSTWFPISPFRTSIYHSKELRSKTNPRPNIIAIDIFGASEDYSRASREEKPDVKKTK